LRKRFLKRKAPFEKGVVGGFRTREEGLLFANRRPTMATTRKSGEGDGRALLRRGQGEEELNEERSSFCYSKTEAGT